MKIKLISFIVALSCAYFVSAQDAMLDCATSGNGDGTVCAVGLTAFSTSLSSPCGLPNTEYVISDPTTTVDPDGIPGNGDEGFVILGASATPVFDLTTYGITNIDDEFCVTAVCYDLTQLQDLIDGIYGGVCCALVDVELPELCDNLMNAGINSGEDITSLQDLITVVGVFSGEQITLESVVDVIGLLNDNLSQLNIFNCNGGVSNIDYAIDGVNETMNTGTAVSCCFRVVPDTESCNTTDCPTNLDHSGTIDSGDYEIFNSITSEATIGSNQDVTYDAGNFICLNPNFIADANNGSVFFAVIDGCGGFYKEEQVNGIAENPVAFKNYPNPFTGQTTIEFTLVEDAPVTLFVSDAMGRQIAVLLQQESKLEGTHHATFDGNNYPAGMYYYTIQAGAYTGTQKMILIK